MIVFSFQFAVKTRQGPSSYLLAFGLSRPQGASCDGSLQQSEISKLITSLVEKLINKYRT